MYLYNLLTKGLKEITFTQNISYIQTSISWNGWDWEDHFLQKILSFVPQPI
jgi:hypothetical protein